MKWVSRDIFFLRKPPGGEYCSTWYPEIEEPIKSCEKHYSLVLYILSQHIVVLGDPGADSGAEGNLGWKERIFSSLLLFFLLLSPPAIVSLPASVPLYPMIYPWVSEDDILYMHMLTHSQAQKVHSPNLNEDKFISDVVRIGGTIIFHLSKQWEAKFFILCDVIFQVRLAGKFEIDLSWEWKG